MLGWALPLFLARRRWATKRGASASDQGDRGRGKTRACHSSVSSPWDTFTTRCKYPFGEDGSSPSICLGVSHRSPCPPWHLGVQGAQCQKSFSQPGAYSAGGWPTPPGGAQMSVLFVPKASSDSRNRAPAFHSRTQVPRAFSLLSRPTLTQLPGSVPPLGSPEMESSGQAYGSTLQMRKLRPQSGRGVSTAQQHLWQSSFLVSLGLEVLGSSHGRRSGCSGALRDRGGLQELPFGPLRSAPWPPKAAEQITTDAEA